MKKKSKSQSNHWLKSKIVLLAGIMIIAFLGLNFYNTWQQRQAVDREITVLEQDINKLEQTNIELSELIEYLNSNAYIEKKARTDLGLKKEGEKIVIIPNTNQNINLRAQTGTEKNLATASNPVKWWHYFFTAGQ